MKSSLYIKAFLLSIIAHVFQSAAFSAVFCALKWCTSLLSISNPPTWKDFIFGGVGLFVFFSSFTFYKLCKTVSRCRKDPMFEDAHIKTGISWEDYQQIKRLQEKEKKTMPEKKNEDGRVVPYDTTPEFKIGDIYRIYDDVNGSWHTIKVISLPGFPDEIFEGLLDGKQMAMPKKTVIEFWERTKAHLQKRQP